MNAGYGTEDSVGRAIHDSALDRSELFITTKWSGLSTIPEAIDNSLSKVTGRATWSLACIDTSR